MHTCTAFKQFHMDIIFLLLLLLLIFSMFLLLLLPLQCFISAAISVEVTGALVFLVSHFFELVDVQYAYRCARPYVYPSGGVNMTGKSNTIVGKILITASPWQTQFKEN